MLDKQDLQAIGKLMNEAIERCVPKIVKDVTEGRFAKIDKRFEEMDERFAKIDERFEEMDERFAKIDERFEEIDERFEKIEKQLKETQEFLEHCIVEVDVTASERDRKTREELNARFDRIEEYYRIRKLEDQNQSMIIRMVYDLDKRVKKLEAAPA